MEVNNKKNIGHIPHNTDNKFDNNINFEEASDCWRQNKKYIGKGYFRYKCKLCDNLVYSYTTHHKHFNLFANEFDMLNKNNPKQFEFCEDHLYN